MSYAVRQAPFRFKGAYNVEDCTTSQEVMEKAGLNWEVEKGSALCGMDATEDTLVEYPNFIHGHKIYSEIPNAFAIYRKDNNIPLGLVKGRYNIVQNSEAFKFFDGAIGKDKAIWQTAGCFGNGEKVFVSAKLPNNITVAGNDHVENYLVFLTSHDGSTGVKILLTPVRIVCQNTLTAAVRQAKNFISFRHTNSVHDNLGIADQILGICRNTSKFVQEEYNNMLKQTYTDKQAREAFASVILNDRELTSLKDHGYTVDNLFSREWNAIDDSKISMKKVNTLCKLEDYYHVGPGQAEHVGNGWGIFGAVTGYYSNVDESTGIKRMDSLLFGDKANKIKESANLILNYNS